MIIPQPQMCLPTGQTVLPCHLPGRSAFEMQPRLPIIQGSQKQMLSKSYPIATTQCPSSKSEGQGVGSSSSFHAWINTIIGTSLTSHYWSSFTVMFSLSQAVNPNLIAVLYISQGSVPRSQLVFANLAKSDSRCGSPQQFMTAVREAGPQVQSVAWKTSGTFRVKIVLFLVTI